MCAGCGKDIRAGNGKAGAEGSGCLYVVDATGCVE